MRKMKEIPFVLILAIVAVTLLPVAISAQETKPTSTPPETLSRLWLDAIDNFALELRNPSEAQLAVILEASEIGSPDTFEEARYDRLRKLSIIIERMQRVFTQDQLGALFTSIDPVQKWLVDAEVLPTPHCNCQSPGGTCQFGGGGPSGNCQTGCVSWTGDDGGHRTGICNAVSIE